jgi:hypothetical protein
MSVNTGKGLKPVMARASVPSTVWSGSAADGGVWRAIHVAVGLCVPRFLPEHNPRVRPSARDRFTGAKRRRKREWLAAAPTSFHGDGGGQPWCGGLHVDEGKGEIRTRLRPSYGRPRSVVGDPNRSRDVRQDWARPRSELRDEERGRDRADAPGPRNSESSTPWQRTQPSNGGWWGGPAYHWAEKKASAGERVTAWWAPCVGAGEKLGCAGENWWADSTELSPKRHFSIFPFSFLFPILSSFYFKFQIWIWIFLWVSPLSQMYTFKSQYRNNIFYYIFLYLFLLT